MAKEAKAKLTVEQLKERHQVVKYDLSIDMPGEGLEPTYYWILDFLKTDLGYDVSKVADYFGVSATSGYFSEMGTKRTQMEKRATELMGSVNMIVKSIINLLYDLKEFEIRLKFYDELKSHDKSKAETADDALKGIWLTDVDTKKGRGSINILATQLDFVTIRDAFMVAKKPEEVDKMDLDDRVKRLLKPRIKEYLEWRDRSEKELRMRFKLERSYLKSQVGALKLYTEWVRPYLLAAHKLRMREYAEEEAEIVTAFDVALVNLELQGTKSVSKEKIPPENQIYKCIGVDFFFRAIPIQPAPGARPGHYAHIGKIIVKFKGYAFTGAELQEIKEKDTEEVLQFISAMTKESLEAMKEDLEKYLAEELKEEKKRIKILPETLEPFTSLLRGVSWLIPFAKRAEKKKVKPKMTWAMRRLRAEAKKAVKSDCWIIYDSYKKAHKMITW